MRLQKANISFVIVKPGSWLSLLKFSKFPLRNKRTIADIIFKVPVPTHHSEVSKAVWRLLLTSSSDSQISYHVQSPFSKTLNNWGSCQNTFSSSFTLKKSLLFLLFIIKSCSLNQIEFLLLKLIYCKIHVAVFYFIFKRNCIIN